MTLREVADRLSLDIKSTKGNLTREVTGCYISDLLSDVMAHAQEGQLWITLQTHPNIIAVASLKNLAGVVITNRRSPEDETLKKAEDERIILATSQLSTFETGGMLYQLLKC